MAKISNISIKALNQYLDGVSSSEVNVYFEDSKYNYATPVRGTDEDIRDYFVGKYFNMGFENDNPQKCIEIQKNSLQSIEFNAGLL